MSVHRNDREARVLRDACEVNGIPDSVIENMQPYEIKDVLMHTTSAAPKSNAHPNEDDRQLPDEEDGIPVD